MLTLVIGDKNLSSWSLRPWLMLKQTGIAFTEHQVALDRPDTRQQLAAVSPSGLVPVLRDDDLIVWDSLAIGEYLNERFPEARLWPADPAARAVARAMSAEMHSGFSALRTVWPMQFTRQGMAHTRHNGVQRDIDRILELWCAAKTRFGGDGPFLFGAFSIADAMYAPVVSRFVTYGPVAMPEPARRWADMMWGLPAMREWGEGARREVAP